MEEEERSLVSFLKWAAQLGISDCPSEQHRICSSLGHSLRVSHFPDAGGRGLAAIRDLSKGELILRVPKSALMTRESLLKDPKLSLAVDKHSSLTSTQILTVCLLYELGKGKHSWWHPYLMQLPRSYDTLASFGQFETQALQVNDAIWATEKAIGKAESDWKEAIALMEELQLKCCLQTFEAWLWASATISSRTMHIPWDNAGCLCPVGDFFNYAAPGEEEFDSGDAFVSEDSSRSRSSMQEQSSCNGETRQQFDVEEGDSNLLRLTDGGYEESTSAYCFYARRNYKKGEQVLLSYGTYTNLELLEHYGFLLERNPNDKVFIPLVPEIYSSCSWSTDLLHLHQNGKPSFALLSSLRLWLTPLNQRRSVGHLVYSGSQLSVDNEIAVMGWIAKSCKVLLENFVTSVEEDKLLLNTIDKMQVISTLTQSKNVLSEEFKGEAYAFLENVGLINGEFSVKLLHCRKIKRCLDRWKIAVQWRLRYKRIVADCISYCTESISKLAQDCSFESL